MSHVNMNQLQLVINLLYSLFFVPPQNMVLPQVEIAFYIGSPPNENGAENLLYDTTCIQIYVLFLHISIPTMNSIKCCISPSVEKISNPIKN